MSTVFGSTPEASNPYKVKVVRPPMYRLEDLEPLSRMRHPYTYAITNPGVRNSFVNCGLSEAVDKQPIESAISVTKLGTNYPNIIPPTATYRISFPQEVDGSYAVRDYTINAPLSSQAKGDWLNFETNRDIQSTQKYKVINDSPLTYEYFQSLPSDLKDTPQNRDTQQGIRDETILDSISTNVSSSIIDTPRTTDIDYQNAINNHEYLPVVSQPNSNIYLDKNNYNNHSGKINQDYTPIPISSLPTDNNRVKNNFDPQYQFSRNSVLESVQTSINGDYTKPVHSDIPELKNKNIGLSHSSNPKIYYENPEHNDLRDDVRTKRKPTYNNMEDFASKGISKDTRNNNVKLKQRKN
jgi:hypothetical protein